MRLLPLGGPFAATSGTKFVLDTGDAVAAKVSDLTIVCGDPSYRDNCAYQQALKHTNASSASQRSRW